MIHELNISFAIIFFFAFIIPSLLLVVDSYIILKEWCDRIHIGRWNDRKEWQKAIEKRAKRWLYNLPTVKASSQDRLMLLDIIRGRFKNSNIQKWQIAGLLLGLDDSSVEKYSINYTNIINKHEFLPEDLLIAYALKVHNRLDSNIEIRISNFYDSVKKNGTVYYRPWVKDIRFVDTIGMALPYFQLCGWDDLVKRQIEEYDIALLNGIFPAHAFDMEKRVPMGIYDWCRGVGWYILGLIEATSINRWDTRIIVLAKALIKLQKDDGGFSCFIFNPKERTESSGTVIIGLLFVTAYKISKNKEYIDAAYRVEKYLMKATRRNGSLDFCQGDTHGIGYYSRTFTIMPFAQGLSLKLSKELDCFTNENS